MARTPMTYKKKMKKESSDQFFLYVAFHSALSAVANFFKED
jgi:hypothetical protein